MRKNGQEKLPARQNIYFCKSVLSNTDSTQKTAAGISLRLFSQNGFPFIRFWFSDPNYRLTLITVTAPAIATIPRTAKIRIPASPGLDGVVVVEDEASLLEEDSSTGSA